MINTKAHSIRTAIKYYGRFFVLVSIIWACSSKEEIVDKPLYTGPIMSLDSVNSLLSDSALVLIQIRAPKEDVFENGNREWNKGLALTYFEKNGDVSSSFRSDYAIYEKEKELYRGEGNVVVRSLRNGDELSTELLFWDPNKKEFYTDRFVTIHSEDEIHTGEGLTANQDFTSYKILKPAGTFTLEEEAQVPR